MLSRHVRRHQHGGGGGSRHKQRNVSPSPASTDAPFGEDLEELNTAKKRQIYSFKESDDNIRPYSPVAETLFRKDLISAMKLPDNEPLTVNDYWIVCDTWKPEWERCVQVPFKPKELPEPRVSRVVRHNSYNVNRFTFPKKYLCTSLKGTSYTSDTHHITPMSLRSEQVCAYDLDQVDHHWLTAFNGELALMGMSPISEIDLEQIIEDFEQQCWEKIEILLRSNELQFEEDCDVTDDSIICDVCRNPDSEEGNEMVFCDNCNICVHQKCYGITSIPSGDWLCRTCALSIKPKCELCPNKGGAMKPTKSGKKWAHVSCALWIPEVSIGCVDSMEPITKISTIPQDRWNLMCVLCKERAGSCIQCSVNSCKTAYHVTCAFKGSLEMRAIIEDENTDDGVKLRSYCLKHSMNKRRRDSDESDLDDLKDKKCKMSTEELDLAKRKRILEIEGDFFKYVDLNATISKMGGIDRKIVDIIYSFWLLKRRSGNNAPLMPPRADMQADLTSSHNAETGASDNAYNERETLKLFVHLRQDLERVRNLCYMVSRREKLRRTFVKLREQILEKQLQIIMADKTGANTQPQMSFMELSAVLEANHGPSIYDRVFSDYDAEVHSQDDFEVIFSQISGDVKFGSDDSKRKLHYAHRSDRNHRLIASPIPPPYKRIFSDSSAEETDTAAVSSLNSSPLREPASPIKKRGRRTNVLTQHRKQREHKVKTLRHSSPSLSSSSLASSSDDNNDPEDNTINYNSDVSSSDVYSDRLSAAVVLKSRMGKKNEPIYSEDEENESEDGFQSSCRNRSSSSIFRTKAAMKDFSVNNNTPNKRDKGSGTRNGDSLGISRKSKLSKKSNGAKSRKSDFNTSADENDFYPLIVPERAAARKAAAKLKVNTDHNAAASIRDPPPPPAPSLLDPPTYISSQSSDSNINLENNSGLFLSSINDEPEILPKKNKRGRKKKIIPLSTAPPFEETTVLSKSENESEDVLGLVPQRKAAKKANVYLREADKQIMKREEKLFEPSSPVNKHTSPKKSSSILTLSQRLVLSESDSDIDIQQTMSITRKSVTRPSRGRGSSSLNRSPRKLPSMSKVAKELSSRTLDFLSARETQLDEIFEECGLSNTKSKKEPDKKLRTSEEQQQGKNQNQSDNILSSASSSSCSSGSSSSSCSSSSSSEDEKGDDVRENKSQFIQAEGDTLQPDKLSESTKIPNCDSPNLTQPDVHISSPIYKHEEPIVPLKEVKKLSPCRTDDVESVKCVTVHANKPEQKSIFSPSATTEEESSNECSQSDMLEQEKRELNDIDIETHISSEKSEDKNLETNKIDSPPQMTNDVANVSEEKLQESLDLVETLSKDFHNFKDVPSIIDVSNNKDELNSLVKEDVSKNATDEGYVSAEVIKTVQGENDDTDKDLPPPVASLHQATSCNTGEITTEPACLQPPAESWSQNDLISNAKNIVSSMPLDQAVVDSYQRQTQAMQNEAFYNYIYEVQRKFSAAPPYVPPSASNTVSNQAAAASQYAMTQQMKNLYDGQKVLDQHMSLGSQLGDLFSMNYQQQCQQYLQQQMQHIQGQYDAQLQSGSTTGNRNKDYQMLEQIFQQAHNYPAQAAWFNQQSQTAAAVKMAAVQQQHYHQPKADNQQVVSSDLKLTSNHEQQAKLQLHEKQSNLREFELLSQQQLQREQQLFIRQRELSENVHHNYKSKQQQLIWEQEQEHHMQLKEQELQLQIKQREHIFREKDHERKLLEQELLREHQQHLIQQKEEHANLLLHQKAQLRQHEQEQLLLHHRKQQIIEERKLQEQFLLNQKNDDHARQLQLKQRLEAEEKHRIYAQEQHAKLREHEERLMMEQAQRTLLCEQQQKEQDQRALRDQKEKLFLEQQHQKQHVLIQEQERMQMEQHRYPNLHQHQIVEQNDRPQTVFNQVEDRFMQECNSLPEQTHIQRSPNSLSNRDNQIQMSVSSSQSNNRIHTVNSNTEILSCIQESVPDATSTTPVEKLPGLNGRINKSASDMNRSSVESSEAFGISKDLLDSVAAVSKLPVWKPSSERDADLSDGKTPDHSDSVSFEKSNDVTTNLKLDNIETNILKNTASRISTLPLSTTPAPSSISESMSDFEKSDYDDTKGGVDYDDSDNEHEFGGIESVEPTLNDQCGDGNWHNEKSRSRGRPAGSKNKVVKPKVPNTSAVVTNSINGRGRGGIRGRPRYKILTINTKALAKVHKTMAGTDYDFDTEFDDGFGASSDLTCKKANLPIYMREDDDTHHASVNDNFDDMMNSTQSNVVKPSVVRGSRGRGRRGVLNNTGSRHVPLPPVILTPPHISNEFTEPSPLPPPPPKLPTLKLGALLLQKDNSQSSDTAFRKKRKKHISRHISQGETDELQHDANNICKDLRAYRKPPKPSIEKVPKLRIKLGPKPLDVPLPPMDNKEFSTTNKDINEEEPPLELRDKSPTQIPAPLEEQKVEKATENVVSEPIVKEDATEAIVNSPVVLSSEVTSLNKKGSRIDTLANKLLGAKTMNDIDVSCNRDIESIFGPPAPLDMSTAIENVPSVITNCQVALNNLDDVEQKSELDLLREEMVRHSQLEVTQSSVAHSNETNAAGTLTEREDPENSDRQLHFKMKFKKVNERQTITSDSANSTLSQAAPVDTVSGAHMRRMNRKKELLNQYYEEDLYSAPSSNNMFLHSNTKLLEQIMPQPAPLPPPPPTVRNIIKMPKAVASVTSVPTRADYQSQMEANLERKRKRENVAASGSGSFERTADGAKVAEKGGKKKKGGRGIRGNGDEDYRPKSGETAASKVALAAEKKENIRKTRGKPPKKCLAESSPTHDPVDSHDFKAESMKFAEKMMASFEAETSSIMMDKKRRKRSKPDSNSADDESASTDNSGYSTKTPRLVIKFSKEENATGSSKSFIPAEETEGFGSSQLLKENASVGPPPFSDFPDKIPKFKIKMQKV